MCWLHLWQLLLAPQLQWTPKASIFSWHGPVLGTHAGCQFGIMVKCLCSRRSHHDAEVGTTVVTQKREKKAAMGDQTTAVAMNLLTLENAKRGRRAWIFFSCKYAGTCLGDVLTRVCRSDQLFRDKLWNNHRFLWKPWCSLSLLAAWLRGFPRKEQDLCSRCSFIWGTSAGKCFGHQFWAIIEQRTLLKVHRDMQNSWIWKKILLKRTYFLNFSVKGLYWNWGFLLVWSLLPGMFINLFQSVDKDKNKMGSRARVLNLTPFFHHSLLHLLSCLELPAKGQESRQEDISSSP